MLLALGVYIRLEGLILVNNVLDGGKAIHLALHFLG